MFCLVLDVQCTGQLFVLFYRIMNLQRYRPKRGVAVFEKRVNYTAQKSKQ